ncbi:hypothetical protein DPMN_112098 [Dreissena polymorpha]|uniref:Uncharacterized protein n=1 Tax=Dreissena polymorpha TaxID=45954 RepID=A0A9D4KF11_DREPO|nr:hypothetical protein DPMN_112098 [Dreissena polymorpha]
MDLKTSDDNKKTLYKIGEEQQFQITKRQIEFNKDPECDVSDIEAFSDALETFLERAKSENPGTLWHRFEFYTNQRKDEQTDKTVINHSTLQTVTLKGYASDTNPVSQVIVAMKEKGIQFSIPAVVNLLGTVHGKELPDAWFHDTRLEDQHSASE